MKMKRWTGRINTESGVVEQAGYSFMCPGCKERHSVVTQGAGPQWTFNGDEDHPVLTPSVLVTGYRFVGPGDEAEPIRCHSFVGCNGAQTGQIIFLNDCSHVLAGQVVDLPEL